MMERVRHHDHRFKPYEKRVQISCNAQLPTRTVAKALPFAPSAEPTLTQFAQTAKPSLAEETTTMDQVSTSPSTPPRTVTLAAIQTARAAFEQRVREAAATDDGLPLDDIVIASPVTRRQLDRVPDHWLYGIRVMLRADGALVITKLATQQHERACGELGWQLGTYARGNGMVAQPTLPLTLPDGSVVTPDVQIFRPETDQNPIPVPLALFEVEVHHRCLPKMIETAADYLHQLPSVVQVVFLKYFPPRQPALRANELRVPAMLLVFRRASGANAGLIEVAQMCSFGNKKIHGTVVRTLARPSGYHVPYTVTEQQRAPADWLPDAFTLGSLLDELAQLLAQPNHAMFYVDMPQGLPPIPVDLVSEFVEAMRGWRRDRAVPTCRSLRLAAP